MADHPTISGDDATARELLTGISKLAIALRAHAWRDARARGLTPTQSQILALLDTDAPLRLNEVARALGVSPATASDAVSTLVNKGLVLKRRQTDDVRSVSISLTETGTEQSHRSMDWPDSFLAAMTTLPREEQTRFLQTLVKLLVAFQEYGHLAAARVCLGCRFFRPDVYTDDPAHTHHCAALNLQIADHALRTDCSKHEPLYTKGVKQSWERPAESEANEPVET